MRVPRRKTKNRFRGLLSRIKGIPEVIHFPGNSVILLPHGGDFFPALFMAIQSARTTICVEFYIIKPDATGQRFADVLRQAAGRGVAVSLLYDAIGCFDTPAAYFQHLQAGGVRCIAFNPPAFSRLHWLDVRDHRKMVVVDGTIAFLGGLNVGDEYSGYGDSVHRWRDIGIRLDGPVAGELQRLFWQTWRGEGGPSVPEQHDSPGQAAGEANVVIVNGTPHHTRSVIRNSFRLAMAGSSRSIRIITPYFVPGPRVVRSLLRAVRRGVEVRIILPSISDVPLVQIMSRAYLKPLLEAGVAIFERQGTILHAKVMLVDDRWSTFGSANLDFRSFHRNHEINVIIDSRAFGEQVAALFEEEVTLSRRITLSENARRNRFERLCGWLLTPLSRFL
ncbi:phospholipase D/Transphosphatidylase [Desulfobulbus propionicus DSM 2032]|uniref:Phospholipase D/Transphosphatidylase n=1 Tax=Desulfobulbus propionicus (strain ATCC 33891 / DSM 2032 / VKM B-1956 / 1pr3) TaxID=577650 RepID=A0A7U3YJZ5_DESPD|nr:phospholipase D-like domain-containing protein [Desulfobulbus propionicus]ADW16735.1 phospholipase D/Transphosphatidylase [Desulfobulbus propionicus DSM 2032]